MTKNYNLFIFSGETSGDIHGAELIKKIKKKDPSLSICGVTGPKMKKEEIDTVLDVEAFQVMGFVDIILCLPRLIKQYFYLKKYILRTNPKNCIFIDYPEFNLILQSALRKSGYKGKIIHYICPSVWAWRKSRIKTMQKNLDLLLCIYPFEKRFLNNSLPTKYVGNPLIESLKNHEIKENSFPYKNKVIGVFPGSRSQEIKNNLPIQLEAMIETIKRHPDHIIVVSISNKKHKKLICDIANKFKKYFNEKLVFIPSSKNYEMMKNLTLAIATSGTINLELAFHKVPSIITYYIKPVDLFIARNILKINLPFYCIVNIIAKKMIFPELYGPNLTKDNLHYYLNKILLEKSFENKIREECGDLKKLFYENHEQEDIATTILSTIEH